MAYKARSFKIQSVLQKLRKTFGDNLKEAASKEKDSKAQYDDLSSLKKGQLATARKALTQMETENGAKGLSREESQEEVDALTTQVKDDKTFIAETQAGLKAKANEWKKRSELRAAESAAISKAIYVLHNDDARDTFTKAVGSAVLLQLQPPSFLQTSSVSQRANAAAAALREVAQRSTENKAFLSELASSIQKPQTFDEDKLGGNSNDFRPVLRAIDKMIRILESQKEEDLRMKEQCEMAHMYDTQQAIRIGRKMDDMTDTITQLSHEKTVLQEEIEKLTGEFNKVKQELEAATRIRNDENADWVIADKTDEQAARTVANAKSVIEEFYKTTRHQQQFKVFVQIVSTQPAVEAGQAPPPPPATWEGGYGTKDAESQGIVALLDMIHEDILKEQAAHKAEEETAAKEYSKFKKTCDKQMKQLAKEKNFRLKSKGEKESAVTDTKNLRRTQSRRLQGKMEDIAAATPTCEYFLVNFPLRRKNRSIELDGLQKAKTILQGGTFEADPDPDREIKPGDAASSASFLEISRKRN